MRRQGRDKMDLHFDLRHTDWLHELFFPLLLFAVPLAISLVWTGEVLLLTLPLMALAGFLFAPRHLWPIWLGSCAILWGVQGVAALMGEFATDRVGAGLRDADSGDLDLGLGQLQHRTQLGDDVGLGAHTSPSYLLQFRACVSA